MKLLRILGMILAKAPLLFSLEKPFYSRSKKEDVMMPNGCLASLLAKDKNSSFA